MRTKKKWILYVVIGLVAAILLTAVGLAIYYVVIGKKTLEQVTTPEEPKVVFSVYVLTEDSAESIQDTQGYPYGIGSSDAQLEQGRRRSPGLRRPWEKYLLLPRTRIFSPLWMGCENRKAVQLF